MQIKLADLKVARVQMS